MSHLLIASSSTGTRLEGVWRTLGSKFLKGSKSRVDFRAFLTVLAADIHISGMRSTLHSDSMTSTKFLSSLFASMAVASLLLGCQRTEQPTETPPFGSLAQITAISPDTTQMLHAGEQVKLKVDVSHVLTAESGTIKLVVLAADNSDIAQGVKLITKGTGKSTLEVEFKVPSTTVIRVFAPLVVQGQNSTSLADGRTFEVTPN